MWARVAAIREELGADAHLTIDANQSYQPKDAIQAITLMAPFRIELVEQPVAGERSPRPQAGDRCGAGGGRGRRGPYSLDQVFRICQERAADAVSLKLCQDGRLARHARGGAPVRGGRHPLRLGAHSGPRLVAAHAVNLAAALPGIWYNCELTLFEDLAEDPWEGLEVVDGVLSFPPAPAAASPAAPVR